MEGEEEAEVVGAVGEDCHAPLWSTRERIEWRQVRREPDTPGGEGLDKRTYHYCTHILDEQHVTIAT